MHPWLLLRAVLWVVLFPAILRHSNAQQSVRSRGSLLQLHHAARGGLGVRRMGV
jgi:hypothetical protein